MIAILAPGGPDALWTALFVALVLGGASAYATGRAVAATWRSPVKIIWFSLLLAGALGFLDYALFGNPVIPGGRIVEAVSLVPSAPAAALADLAASLAGFVAVFCIVLAMALASFRLTRARQISNQYQFAYERKGLFGWRPGARREAGGGP